MREKKQIWKRGFTLLELVTALTIFSFVTAGVLMAIYKIYGLVLFSKSEILAINYAKSWMEWVMNVRDTNRRKYSSTRDDNWLRSDPFRATSPLINSWLYVLAETGIDITVSQKYLLLSGTSFGSDEWNTVYNNFKSISADKKDIFILTGDQGLSFPGTTFYRIIRVFGIFDKRGANANTYCPAAGCWAGHPQELRYCVKVIWINRTPGETELCGILTNFKK